MFTTNSLAFLQTITQICYEGTIEMSSEPELCSMMVMYVKSGIKVKRRKELDKVDYHKSICNSKQIQKATQNITQGNNDKLF